MRKNTKYIFVLVGLAILLSVGLAIVSILDTNKTSFDLITAIMMIVLILISMIFLLSSLKSQDKKPVLYENDFLEEDNLEEDNFGTWLSIFGIIALTGLFLMLILMVLKGFKINYLLCYLASIGLLVLFLAIPIKKKKDTIKKPLNIVMIIGTLIILASGFSMLIIRIFG